MNIIFSKPTDPSLSLALLSYCCYVWQALHSHTAQMRFTVRTAADLTLKLSTFVILCQGRRGILPCAAPRASSALRDAPISCAQVP